MDTKYFDAALREHRESTGDATPVSEMSSLILSKIMALAQQLKEQAHE